ncbi:NPCBM/NEW2 domain-containing protein, partial [Frankia sp. Cas4]|uniref:NPCBM/NEW2 domain-containing protein n=1 Tax=Frankia sp. Cas4 TaxID=3073927 RepID=UPI002AD215FC
PATLIELCRAASTDERLRIGEGWLPSTVTAEITRYSVAPPKPPQPRPQPQPQPQPRTEPRQPQPPAPSPWVPPRQPAPPNPAHHKPSPWLIGGLGTAALVVVIVAVAALSNRSSDGKTNSGTTTNTSTGTGTSATGSASTGPATATGAPATTAGSGNPTSKPTAAPGNVDRFLTDLTVIESDGKVESGSGSISGTKLPHSVILQANHYDDPKNVARAEYDLGRDYRRLQATVGLADDARSNAVYQIEIYGDDRRLASHTVRLGNSVPIDLDVTGILRLRLTTTRVDGDVVDNDYSHYASASVFGDARITGVQGEVPTAVASSPS